MGLVPLLLVVILVLILVGAWPTWPHAAGWGLGYYPSGIVGVLVIVLIVLLLTGRL